MAGKESARHDLLAACAVRAKNCRRERAALPVGGGRDGSAVASSIDSLSELFSDPFNELCNELFNDSPPIELRDKNLSDLAPV